MRRWRQDLLALGAFALIAIAGAWLWTGTGPLIWLNQFAMMCGFSF